MVFDRVLDALRDRFDACAVFHDDIDIYGDAVFFYIDINARMRVAAGEQSRQSIDQLFARHADNAVALVDGVTDDGDDCGG